MQIYKLTALLSKKFLGAFFTATSSFGNANDIFSLHISYGLYSYFIEIMHYLIIFIFSMITVQKMKYQGLLDQITIFYSLFPFQMNLKFR